MLRASTRVSLRPAGLLRVVVTTLAPVVGRAAVVDDGGAVGTPLAVAWCVAVVAVGDRVAAGAEVAVGGEGSRPRLRSRPTAV